MRFQWFRSRFLVRGTGLAHRMIGDPAAFSRCVIDDAQSYVAPCFGTAPDRALFFRRGDYPTDIVLHKARMADFQSLFCDALFPAALSPQPRPIRQALAEFALETTIFRLIQVRPRHAVGEVISRRKTVVFIVVVGVTRAVAEGFH
jgi:hypothetical protein